MTRKQFLHALNVVSARNKQGQWLQIPLASQPIYVTALKIAREHRQVGLFDNEIFKALALRSCELDAVSKALNAGASIQGATLATALVALQAEDLTPTSWLSRVRRAVFG